MDEIVLNKFIRDAGISYKQTSKSYVFSCPRCSKKDKLYIRKKDGKFICFRCDESERFHGKAEYALAELLGTSPYKIRQQLYDPYPDYKPRNKYIDIDFSEEVANPEASLIPEKIQWPLDIYNIDHPFSKKGLAYLESRGINEFFATNYGLRYSPSENRVIFPVYRGDELYGWQGRYIKKDTKVPKMLSSQGFQKSKFLMFEENIIPKGHIVICEGPIDAIKAHLCGGNIATMGKGISETQIGLITNYRPSRIYLALDPDAANETNALLQKFGDYECYLLWPTKGKKDLGEMSMEEVWELFKLAPRITKHQICVYLK